MPVPVRIDPAAPDTYRSVSEMQRKSWSAVSAAFLLLGCPAEDGVSEADTTSEPTGGEPTGGEPTGGEPTGGDTDGPQDEGRYRCPSSLAFSDALYAATTRSRDDGGKHGELRGAVLRIDPDTEERETVVLGGDETEFQVVAVADDGDLVVSGWTVGFVANGSLLARYGADGTSRWTVEPDGVSTHDMALRGDEVFLPGGSTYTGFTVLSAEDGTVTQEIVGDGNTHQIEVDAMGSVVVAGATGDAVDPMTDPQAAFVRRYDADLQLVSEHLEPSAAADNTVDIEGLALDADGGAVLAVHERRDADGVSQLWQLRKYDIDGVGAWAVELHEPVPGAAVGAVYDLAARPGGGVVAVGRIATDEVAFTFAYDSAGTLLWSDQYEDPTLTQVRNSAVAVTPNTLFVKGCASGEPGELVEWLLQLQP